MEWKSIKTTSDGEIVLPDTIILPHYYDALNTLFRIENALRVFVYVVLKSELKSNWQTINILSDDAAESTIGRIAKQRMNQTKQFGYLGYQIPCPLMYMTSGELIRIITSESYWKYFSNHFLGSKEVIKLKLNEIGIVRNALAHFRPIRLEDVELIKQNAQHVLPRIESSLVDLMQCPNVVPTNTCDQWYTKLKSLGTEDCSLFFTQSNNEKWVKVKLRYQCPTVASQGSKWFKNFKVLTINTSAILSIYPDLQSLLIFLSESISLLNDKDETKFSKYVSFLLSREQLETDSEKIYQQFKCLLDKISQETNLLKADNLARGELVIGVEVNAQLIDEKYWEFNYQNLRCINKDSDHPEYWGEMNSIDTNYVTSTTTYPWMSVDVSNAIYPF